MLVAPRAPREGARRAEDQDPRDPRGGQGRQGRHQEHHRVRRVRRPRRHRRPAPHHRHELGPGQPPVGALPGRRRGHRPRPQVQPRDRARLARPQADPGRPLEPRRRGVPAGQEGHAARCSRSPTTARSSSSSRASRASSTSARCRGPRRSSTRARSSRSARKSSARSSRSTRRAKRISLGLKQLEPDPWTLFTEKYTPGDKIGGKVRSITDYGVFIGIEEGVDGMVHKSDISWTAKVNNPADLYKKGDDVEAIILSHQPRREEGQPGRQAALGRPVADHLQRAAPGQGREGARSLSIVDYGVFVHVRDGIEGLIPQNELVARRRTRRQGEALPRSGDEVEAEIANIDTQERRITLSMRMGEAAAAARGGDRGEAGHARRRRPRRSRQRPKRRRAAPSESSSSRSSARSSPRSAPRRTTARTKTTSSSSPSPAGWRRSLFLWMSAAVAVAIMIAAREVMLPFILAIVIAYVLTPLVASLERRKMSRGPGGPLRLCGRPRLVRRVRVGDLAAHRATSSAISGTRCPKMSEQATTAGSRPSPAASAPSGLAPAQPPPEEAPEPAADKRVRGAPPAGRLDRHRRRRGRERRQLARPLGHRAGARQEGAGLRPQPRS